MLLLLSDRGGRLWRWSLLLPLLSARPCLLLVWLPSSLLLWGWLVIVPTNLYHGISALNVNDPVENHGAGQPSSQPKRRAVRV